MHICRFLSMSQVHGLSKMVTSPLSAASEEQGSHCLWLVLLLFVLFFLNHCYSLGLCRVQCWVWVERATFMKDVFGCSKIINCRSNVYVLQRSVLVSYIWICFQVLTLVCLLLNLKQKHNTVHFKLSLWLNYDEADGEVLLLIYAWIKETSFCRFMSLQ